MWQEQQLTGDLYYFYTLTSHLILTGRTIIIVEEMFTEFTIFHDLRLCPGDCSCNCFIISLCFKLSSSFTSSTSL